jgi:hypothetical protein
MRTFRHSERIKTALAALALLMATGFVFLGQSCHEEPIGPPLPPHPDRGLVSHTTCKAAPGPTTRAIAPVEDCIEFVLSQNYTLTLKHVNAAFNCCPTDLLAKVTVRGDTITIVERDSLVTPCHCLCLYDLDYRLEYIRPGTYTVLIVEPYITDADMPLRFTVDIAPSKPDTFCVARIGYPWNAGSSTGPTIRLLSQPECITPPSVGAAEQVPTDMDCVEYRDQGGGALGLKHIHAAFNCCPGQIWAETRLSNDTLTIIEHEERSICDCSCLYNLEYQLGGLEPHPYVIRFVEPYMRLGDKPLEFRIDLASTKAEFIGRYRGYYPWLYSSTMADDKLVLDRMRHEITDSVGAAPCQGTGDCRYIGLGANPCGGPREYLVYSAATGNEIPLKFLVSKYNAFNAGYNARYHIFGPCIVPPLPELGCVRGRCSDFSNQRE